MTLVVEIQLKNMFILHLYGRKNITPNTQYVARKHCFIQFPSNIFYVLLILKLKKLYSNYAVPIIL